MKTLLRKIFEERGIRPKDVVLKGVSHSTLMKHLNGTRVIAAETALRYEALLGIPRWELRPDLWDPPEKGK